MKSKHRLPTTYREWRKLQPALESVVKDRGCLPTKRELGEKRYRDLLYAVKTYHGGLNAVRARLEDEKERQTLEKANIGRDEEIKKFFAAWHPLVNYKTLRFKKRPDYQRIRIEAGIGLWKAIARRDLHPRWKFRSNAIRLIEKSIRQYLKTRRKK